MKKKGIILINVLMGLAILGLLSVTFIPVFTTTFYNYRIIEIKNDMKYTAETIMEMLKGFSYGVENEEYILDMALKDIMDIFNEVEEVCIQLPQNDNYKCEYNVILTKEDIDDNLWRVEVLINSKENIERLKDVSFKSILPKPIK